MKELYGRRAADAFGPGSSDLVAAIKRVEIELLGVGSAGRWPLNTMVVKAGHDLEQILRGLILMRQDKNAQAPVAADTVIETAGDVGRAPLLAALEDQGPHLSGRGPLRFELLVDETLGAIEYQRRDCAR